MERKGPLYAGGGRCRKPWGVGGGEKSLLHNYLKIYEMAERGGGTKATSGLMVDLILHAATIIMEMPRREKKVPPHLPVFTDKSLY